MPNLCQVANTVALEVHDVDVVRLRALPGRRDGTAVAGVGAGEHGVRDDVVPLLVGRERLQLVAAVGQDRQEALHPICVLLQGVDVLEWLGLRREAGVWGAELLAHFPALARLACVEKSSRDFQNRSAGDFAHRPSSLVLATLTAAQLCVNRAARPTVAGVPA